MKYLILILIYLNQTNLLSQHSEEFLSLTLGNNWMLENRISEIEGKQRWANAKGKLRGRQRKVYSYNDSLGFQFYHGLKYQIEYYHTDSSTIRCQIYKKDLADWCHTSVFKAGQLIRTENYWSTKYFNYDSLGRINSIWSDNSASLDNGCDHMFLYQYDDMGRLLCEIEMSFKSHRLGDYTDDYEDFEVKDVIQAKLNYSIEGTLREVAIYKGTSENDLSLHRILRYVYNDSNLPWKTSYYNYEQNTEVLESEIEYFYK